MSETKKTGEACNNSILRACYILDLFTVENDKWSLKDIAERCDISPTTAIPVLRSLEMTGYLERDPESKLYTLGIKLIEKSQIKINSMNIIDSAAGILREFSKQFRVNTHLARMDMGDVIYLSRYESVVHSLTPSYVGKRIPVYCSSLGKAILAYLPPEDAEEILANLQFRRLTANTKTDPAALYEELEQTRRRGYATDDEEYQMNCFCIAVPIFDYADKVCASISCSIIKTKENMERIPLLAKELQTAGRRISRSIGYRNDI